MNRSEYDGLVEKIAQALNSAGCGYIPEITRRFAEVARDIVLTQGEHGICITVGCRNEALTDIGFPVCHICDECNSYGAAVATANSDLARYGVTLSDGWLERIEERVRMNIMMNRPQPHPSKLR